MAMRSAPATALAGSATSRPSFLAFFQLAPPLRTPAHHIKAAVLEIQGVGTALAP